MYIKLQVYGVTEKEVTKSEVLEFHTNRSYNSSRASNILLEVVKHLSTDNFKLHKNSKVFLLDLD